MPDSLFGLENDPFFSNPDPDYFVDLPTHREALNGLLDWAQSGGGIALLTAPPGLGKTLLCEYLARELAEEFVTLKLGDGNYSSPRELMQTLLFQLDLPYAGLEDHELRLELWNVVKELAGVGQSLLLIVDEAHELSEEMLRELKTLAGGGKGSGPRISLLLSGQLELEELLARRSLSSLNQMIKCHQILESLSRGESANYLAARLERAGADIETVFDEDAVELITHVSDGVPRCLNTIASRCIKLATVRDARPIAEQIVRDAFDKVRHLPLHWNELPEAASLDDDSEPIAPGPIAENQSSVEWNIEANDSSVTADQSPANGPADDEQEDEPVEYATAEFGEGIDEPEYDLGDTQLIEKPEQNRDEEEFEELPPPKPIIDMKDIVSEFEAEFGDDSEFPPIPDEEQVRQVAEDVIELAGAVPEADAKTSDEQTASETEGEKQKASARSGGSSPGRAKRRASPRRNPIDIFAADIPPADADDDKPARASAPPASPAPAPHLNVEHVATDEPASGPPSGPAWETDAPERPDEYDVIEPEYRAQKKPRRPERSLSVKPPQTGQRYDNLFSTLMRRRKV